MKKEIIKKSIFLSLFLALGACDNFKNSNSLSDSNIFTLTCVLLPQKIFKHEYVVDEYSGIVNILTEKYSAKFTSEEITWRVNYPKSTEAYGIHSINRSTGMEKIIFYNSSTNIKKNEETYSCEKISKKF